MFRQCRLCGCTGIQPCITEDGPCSWATTDLCSACVVVLEDGHLIVPKECRNCNLLEEGEPWHDRKLFTCSQGRFDGPDINPPAHQWYTADDIFRLGQIEGRNQALYAWSGVFRPNKGVAAAQKKCPFFEVHTRWRR